MTKFTKTIIIFEQVFGLVLETVEELTKNSIGAALFLPL